MVCVPVLPWACGEGSQLPCVEGPEQGLGRGALPRSAEQCWQCGTGLTLASPEQLQVRVPALRSCDACAGGTRPGTLLERCQVSAPLFQRRSPLRFACEGTRLPPTPMWVHKALSLTQPWPCCSWSQLGQAVPRAASLAASSVPLACRALPERWLGICLRLPGHSCLCCSPGLAGWGLHLKDTGAGGGGHAWAWHWAWLLTGLSINLLLVQPHPPFLGGAGAGAVVLDSLSPPALGPLGEG